MSVSMEDTGFDLTPKNILVLFLGSTTLLFFLVLYALCGTLSPLEAKKRYRQHNDLNEEYTHLFKHRENLVYHISWAQSRSDGKQSEIERMSEELIKLDEEIDAIENKMRQAAKALK